MPLFKSSQPPIKVPDHLPVWTWLFDSEYSPLERYPAKNVQGFTDLVTKEHVSYFDLKKYSTYLSTALVRNYGLRSGETVALFSPNTVWYPVAMFGTLRAGGVITGASPAYNVDEMTHALKTAEVKFLFTAPDSMKVATAAARAAGVPRERLFLLYGTLDGYTTMADLLEIGKSNGCSQVEQFKFLPGERSSNVCGYYSFSGGTTGLPKAVMLSHANVMAQCLQTQQLTPDLSKALAILPLFHIAGLMHQMHFPIFNNAHVYMLPSFSMDAMLQAIQDHKIQDLLLVPPILIRLAHDDEIVRKYDLSSIRSIASGAAPVAPKVLVKLKARFPDCAFKQGYGMTETCACISAHPPEMSDFKYASRCGTLMASTEAKIIDLDTGKECNVNEQGEIWARGPQVAMGYFENNQATEETFDRDGFLHTGDIGFIDDDGMIVVTDRLKEMIKVKGIGVAPAELEDILLGHPDVDDVAVVGITDERAGELPKAFVVLKPQHNRSAREIGRSLIEFVKENKVRYKRIAEVEIIDKIPKSAAGKILRRELRLLQRKGIVVEDDKPRTML